MTGSIVMMNDSDETQPELAEADSPQKILPQELLPWYRQFWPWFIISLPMSVVIAGIATVIIAVKNDDSLVVDNYYKAGLAINQVLTQQDVARQLGITAMVSYSADTHELNVQIPPNLSLKDNALRIRLVHSTQADKDKILLLNRNQQDYFTILVGDIQDGWWNLFIEPIDGQWQISQRILFPMQGKQQIRPSH